jgi:hypothetical protein
MMQKFWIEVLAERWSYDTPLRFQGQPCFPYLAVFGLVGYLRSTPESFSPIEERAHSDDFGNFYNSQGKSRIFLLFEIHFIPSFSSHENGFLIFRESLKCRARIGLQKRADSTLSA